MSFFKRFSSLMPFRDKPIGPLPGEIEEAKRYPSGSVCRIVSQFAEEDTIPPEAIIGAWRVDESGEIVGDFVKNPNYDPKRWPS